MTSIPRTRQTDLMYCRCWCRNLRVNTHCSMNSHHPESKSTVCQCEWAVRDICLSLIRKVGMGHFVNYWVCCHKQLQSHLTDAEKNILFFRDFLFAKRLLYFEYTQISIAKRDSLIFYFEFVVETWFGKNCWNKHVLCWKQGFQTWKGWHWYASRGNFYRHSYMTP